MSYGEASRLARHVKQPLSSAVVVADVPDELRDWWETYSPEHASLIVDGRALFLPLDDGRCRYLGPSGCTVPAAKPHTCALFPFSKVGGEWTVGQLVQSEGFCFGQDSCGGEFDLTLDFFGEDTAHLESIERRRDRDGRVHAAHMRHLKRSG
jgi:Fe-S-cluster containining protein